VINSNVLITLG